MLPHPISKIAILVHTGILGPFVSYCATQLEVVNIRNEVFVVHIRWILCSRAIFDRACQILIGFVD